MNLEKLAANLDRPEIHRQLLGDYAGAYALGITKSDDGQSALLLRVEGNGPENIPAEVLLHDEKVPVIVKKDFKRPEKLPARVGS